MDKPSKENGRDRVSFLPTGDSCEKCGGTKNVQKFDGSYLCKDCRNQHAAMNL